MSETEKTQNVPNVNSHGDHESEQKNLTRRGMLLGAVFGGIGAVKTVEAVECTCLPAPDCNAVCPNGGVPRGDGTQACDCNPPTCVTQDQLAKVAYTGEYADLIDKPDLSAGMPNPASRQKITQSPETKQTLLLKALFNRGFFLVPWRVYMM